MPARHSGKLAATCAFCTSAEALANDATTMNSHAVRVTKAEREPTLKV